MKTGKQIYYAGAGILGFGIAVVVMGIILGSYTETVALFGVPLEYRPYGKLGDMLFVFGILLIIGGIIMMVIGKVIDKDTQQTYQMPYGYYQSPQQPYYQPPFQYPPPQPPQYPPQQPPPPPQ